MRKVLAFGAGLLAVGSAWAQDGPQKPLTVGIDAYAGVSDIPGARRPTDQLWAGQTVFTPSVAYARWQGLKGLSARLALGVGEATLRKPRLFPQPAEAWARQEKNGKAVQVGRFFAAFGQQEWQYQAKNGVQIEAGGFTVAAQERGSFYGRWSGPVGQGATVGVSTAVGRGFSYGSVHDRGFGVDLTAERDGWKLRAESDGFSGPDSARFRFDFARLEWTRNASVQPFAARYDWRDTGPEGLATLGSFRSEICGVNWTLSPHVSLETATARTGGGRRVAWAQLRLTREW